MPEMACWMSEERSWTDGPRRPERRRVWSEPSKLVVSGALKLSERISVAWRATGENERRRAGMSRFMVRQGERGLYETDWIAANSAQFVNSSSINLMLFRGFRGGGGTWGGGGDLSGDLEGE